jgi:hypothetical protein
VFFPGKPYQPSLIFSIKAEAYLREAPFRCYTLGWAFGLIHKQYTRLERLARDKHSCLFQKFMKYGGKSFISFGPDADVIQLFTDIICYLINKLKCWSLAGQNFFPYNLKKHFQPNIIFE